MNKEQTIALLRAFYPVFCGELLMRVSQRMLRQARLARQARMQARIRTLMRRRLHALRRIRNRKPASSPK